MPVGAWYNAAAYSLMCEIYTSERIDGIEGGIGPATTSSDAGYFSGQYWFYGGGIATTIANPPLTPNAVIKLCGTIDNAAQLIRIAINGQIGATAAMTSTPARGTVLAIGTVPWALGGAQLDGHIRRMRYWPRVLGNADLQAITT
jgi:Concanavalin A-like lectin/glucanases superfamily